MKFYVKKCVYIVLMFVILFCGLVKLQSSNGVRNGAIFIKCYMETPAIKVYREDYSDTYFCYYVTRETMLDTFINKTLEILHLKKPIEEEEK